MTITRRWQAGFESNGSASESEFDSYTTEVAASTTYVKTGTYCVRCYGANGARYGTVNVSATRQVRIGFHHYVANTPTWLPTRLLVVRSASAELFSIGYQNANGQNLELLIAGTQQDTLTGYSPSIAWRHIGIDAKIDSSAGWVNVYIDGVLEMSFSGNTGNADIEVIRFGADTGRVTNYYDDCFVDDTAGESAAATVPDYRFEFITPNGNGNYSQTTGSDGNSTDNYLLVDDVPHNSDTDYCQADTLDERDTYAMTTVTIPTGWSVAALIPVVYAKKSDAGTDTEIALTTRYSSTNGDGTAQNLPTSYGYLWERFTTKPGGGAWDQSAIDGVEVGWIGKGTF